VVRRLRSQSSHLLEYMLARNKYSSIRLSQGLTPALAYTVGNLYAQYAADDINEWINPEDDAAKPVGKSSFTFFHEEWLSLLRCVALLGFGLETRAWHKRLSFASPLLASFIVFDKIYMERRWYAWRCSRLLLVVEEIMTSPFRRDAASGAVSSSDYYCTTSSYCSSRASY
jgi:hypothetical protein